MSTCGSNYNKALHEVIDMVDVLCDLQIQNIATSVPYLQGAPGGGKTESIRDLAKRRGDELISCHFALKQPEDIGGIPQFTKEVVEDVECLSTVWSFPEFMSEIYKKSDIAFTKEHGGVFIVGKKTGNIRVGIPKITEEEFTSPEETGSLIRGKYKFNDIFERVVAVEGDEKTHRVLLLMDDMHRCGGWHMTALLEILTEKKFRGYRVPKNVAMILAGNSSQKAGAQAMYSATISRLCIMPVYTDFDHWKTAYAISNGIHLAVLAFLSNDQNKILFHGTEEVDKPWPAPREWTNFSNALTHMEKLYHEKFKSSIPSDVIGYLANGHLGEDVAGKFVAHYKIFNEFETDEIFKTVKSPKDFSKYLEKYDQFQQYPLAYACFNKFMSYPEEIRKTDEMQGIIVNIMAAYADTSVNTSHPEIGVTILKELQISLSALNKNKELTGILDKSAEVKLEDGVSVFECITNSVITVNK